MPDDNLTAEQYEEWAQRYTTLAAWYEQHRMTERARARSGTRGIQRPPSDRGAKGGGEMMAVESYDMTTARQPKKPRQRKASRSLSERAEARRLATMWTIWLRDSGMSMRGLGRELSVGSATLLYLVGRTAPLPQTMTKLRAVCADRYPGGVDDERWLKGPEPRAGVEMRAPAKLPLVPRDPEAPRTRGDCDGMPRPCPAICCARNLLLDVNQKGFPVVDGKTYQVSVTRDSDRGWLDVEEAVFQALANATEQGRETCADDIAERGGLTLAEVAEELGLTKERIRQIERGAVEKLRLSQLTEHAE